MVVFSLRQPPQLKGLVDGSLMFGLPLAAFSQQLLITSPIAHADAWSAAGFALIYGALAQWVSLRYRQTHGLFIYALRAIAVGFATAIIPLTLDAEWISVSFAIEAIGLVWIGFIQQRRLSRFSGVLLYTLACGVLFTQPIQSGETPILRGDFLHLALLSLSAFWLAYLYDRYSARPSRLATLVFAVGCGWWLMAWFLDIRAHAYAEMTALLIMTISLSIAVFQWIARRLVWQRPMQLPAVLLPIAALLWCSQFYSQWQQGLIASPFAGFGSVSIGLMFVLNYRWLARWANGGPTMSSRYHVASAYVASLLIYWQAGYMVQQWQFSPEQFSLLWAVVASMPIALIWLLARLQRWPVRDLATLYLGKMQWPWQLSLIALFVYTAILPLPSTSWGLPVFNIADAVMAFAGVLVCHFFWRSQFRQRIAVATAFVWLNTVLLRALHHHLAIRYELDDLLSDPEVQMALSICWALTATLAMFWASRQSLRTGWIAGLTLMAVVVLKLFVIDLADQGSLTRILSFLFVGAMMLLLGYISPIPPKAAAANTSGSATSPK